MTLDKYLTDPVDLLIIGSGGSGLPAAVTAAEAGASVLVIEKRRMLGGTARLPCGVFAVETQAQKRQGITEPSIDEYYRTHMDYGNWLPDARMVRNWVNDTPEIIRWLEAKGIRFTVGLNLSGPWMIMHQMAGDTVNTGNAIVNALLAEAKERGVEFVNKTTAKKILQDESGRVTGVLVEQDGKQLELKAKAVMIATGTITRNEELQKKFFPHIDFSSIPIMQLPYQTGDGYFMAMDAGAAEDGRVAPLWIGPCTHPFNTRIGNITRRPHPMIVNKRGRRYCDESVWSLKHFGWWTGVALDQQPGKQCFAILDEDTITEIIERPVTMNGMEAIYGRIVGKTISDTTVATERETGMDTDEEQDQHAWLRNLRADITEEVEAGRVLIADTLEEVAEWTGVPLAALKDEVERYNEFCTHGYDADFLKPAEWLRPIRRAPFYVMKAHQGLDMLGGGIRASDKMEILDKELDPIPGLYTGGLAVSGWFGVAGEATGSCCISFSLHSGRVAGVAAAEYAKSLVAEGATAS